MTSPVSRFRIWYCLHSSVFTSISSSSSSSSELVHSSGSGLSGIQNKSGGSSKAGPTSVIGPIDIYSKSSYSSESTHGNATSAIAKILIIR
jgi:hypothetical protein